MILSLLLSIVGAFLQFLFALFPTGNIPVQISASFSFVIGTLRNYDALIPVNQLLFLLGTAVSFYGIILTYKILGYLIKKIPLPIE